MKRLIVMRHASSSYGGADVKRVLTPDGRKEALDLARQLLRRGWCPDYVVSSDATRTRQTWAAMQDLFAAPGERFTHQLYTSGVGDLLAVLQEPETAGEAPGDACEDTRGLVRRCAETVAPVLERSSDHLASLAGAARAASPHEAARAAQLSGVAVRLLQAARRIRLAQQVVLIQHGELKPALASESFDCVAAVRGVLGRLKSLFAATGVDLASELPGEAVEVLADRERVALVVRDLLEVCLAMTAAGGKVTVGVSAGEGDAEITVTDTGCGMSREELEGLFSTEGQPPVHEDYTGGIRDGLFVAKEIMEACGGQLWAESAPGKGTRFNLRIPAP